MTRGYDNYNGLWGSRGKGKRRRHYLVGDYSSLFTLLPSNCYCPFCTPPIPLFNEESLPLDGLSSKERKKKKRRNDGGEKNGRREYEMGELSVTSEREERG